MADLFSSPTFSIAFTLTLYVIFQQFYQRTRVVFFHPVLLTVGSLIFVLKFTEVPFATYNKGGQFISFWLGPSVVALGVPLYVQLATVRRQGVMLLFLMLIGTLTGLLTAVGAAIWLGASREVVLSIAPHSVTTPIAMGIAEKIGGQPSLAAAFVVLTGLFGAILGPIFLKWIGVHSPIAFGLAMGAAAHGIGTARAQEEGELQAAMSGLALCLMGILTAVITPFLIRFLFQYFNL